MQGLTCYQADPMETDQGITKLYGCRTPLLQPTMKNYKPLQDPLPQSAQSTTAKVLVHFKGNTLQLSQQNQTISSNFHHGKSSCK